MKDQFKRGDDDQNEELESDEFGLPNVSGSGSREHKESSKSKAEYIKSAKRYEQTKTRKGNAGRVTFIALLILILLAAGGYYFFLYKPQQEEKARIEQQRLDSIAAAEERQQAMEQARLDSIRMAEEAARQAELERQQAQMNVITERTGKYYVVVASFVDNDLAEDYAEKLVGQGISPTILKREKNFSRVAVDSADSFEGAMSMAENYKAEYGEGVWVLRY